MPNAIYPRAKQQFLQAGINLATATVRVGLVDAGVYTYDSGHEFLSSITGVSGLVGNAVLNNKIFTTDGSFANTTTVTIPLVTGNSAEALVIYVDTGSAATSRLIAYIDTGVTGLPVTPNGNDILIAFEAVTGRIFTL